MEQVGHAAPPPLRLQKFFSFAEAASTFCRARPVARVDGGGDSLSHRQPGENKGGSAHRYVLQRPARLSVPAPLKSYRGAEGSSCSRLVGGL